MDKSDKQDKKIAVIGAGAAGLLTSLALREEGFEPVCFETSDRYGGLWNYREESVVGFASLMATTTINHSKEMGAISNFPPKKEYNNYMRHHELFEYMTEAYKYHHGERYIRFNTEVVKVQKADDYENTGRFSVTVKDNVSGIVSTDIFDGVVVATGHVSYPKMVNFPGMEKFKGEVLHTHSLKRCEKFKDKNVLVIGTGCSGLDAVEHISTFAKQVYLSCRTGMFAFSRVGPKGYPLDYFLFRRYRMKMLDYFPINFCSWYFEKFYIDEKFCHKLYHVKPKYHVLSKDPVINEAIFYNLLSGACIQKGPVKIFTEDGVVFEGEENVTRLDAVVLATGYTYKFPFLENGLLEVNDGRIDLYKCMYPAQLPHPSLVFVGFVQPWGPGTPIGEIQSRWVAHIFSGKGKLPSNKKMLKDVIKRHRKNERRYSPSEYMSVRVDLLSYVDDIASKIGCEPNIIKYFFTDIRLFSKLLFGPSLPYQYRLEGPHKWPGAREAIMTAKERVKWPLTRGK